MFSTVFDFIVFAVILINSACALQCYRCVSSQPGCGRELSIRLERWHSCPDPGPFGGENFCVKIIENIGSDQVITRDCLMTLRHSTRHREKLPTVQRQNYSSLDEIMIPRILMICRKPFVSATTGMAAMELQ